MQAVILAASRGERMGDLTAELPKPLLMVGDRPLLEYKLDALPDSVDEVVIVVGYFGSKIQERFGGLYAGKKLFYVEQETLDGTMGALSRASDILRDRFLVLNGDDIYAPDDLQALAQAKNWSILGLEADDLKSGAQIIVTDGAVSDVVEAAGGSGFANTGAYLLDERIFQATMIPKSEGSSEFGIPQTIIKAPPAVGLIKGTFWLSITSPEDIAAAEEILQQGDAQVA